MYVVRVCYFIWLDLKRENILDDMVLRKKSTERLPHSIYLSLFQASTFLSIVFRMSFSAFVLRLMLLLPQLTIVSPNFPTPILFYPNETKYPISNAIN